MNLCRNSRWNSESAQRQALRVLHVVGSLSPECGGTTASILQMEQLLGSQGIGVDIATSDDGESRDRLLATQNRINRFYFHRRYQTYGFAPAFPIWLKQHIHSYDVVHCHGLFSHMSVAAGKLAHRSRVPYVVTPHGMVNRYGMHHKRLLKLFSLYLIERAVLENAAVVHMTSRAELEQFLELNLCANIETIPLAVAPISRGLADGFLAEHPGLRDKHIIVFVGRLNPVKNLEGLIDAMAEVANMVPNARLVVCGDGSVEYATTLKARAKYQGVGELITWTGFLSGQAKADMLEAANCFILPSHSESFGMAAVEAVSVGLPCVLSEGVAIAGELIAEGLAVGIPPSSHGIAEGIGAAVSLKNKEFIARAKAYVERHFGSHPIGAALANLYYRLGASVAEAKPTVCC